MFLARTEAGKFSVSLRNGSLEEAGVEESQENGRKRFSFRILVGNWLENLSNLAKFYLIKSKFLAMFLAKTDTRKLKSSKRKARIDEGRLEMSQEKARKQFSFRILVGNW